MRAQPRATFALGDHGRCAVAITYDLEMCAGYSPEGVNHGRIAPFLQDYTLDLCRRAAAQGASPHFFYTSNGLDYPDEQAPFLKEILSYGHLISSHTYSHMPLHTTPPEKLDADLARANDLLYRHLGIVSEVLRGPGGYPDEDGLASRPEQREVIRRNGFGYVSGSVIPRSVRGEYPPESLISDRQRFVYDDGLVELAIHCYTDRQWFDMDHLADQTAYDSWRLTQGHCAMPSGWRAPWATPEARERFVAYNLRCMDHAYDNRLLLVFTWHPYTQLIHDPDQRVLASTLQHVRSKAETVWLCTLRDIARLDASARDRSGEG